MGIIKINLKKLQPNNDNGLRSQYDRSITTIVHSDLPESDKEKAIRRQLIQVNRLQPRR